MEEEAWVGPVAHAVAVDEAWMGKLLEDPLLQETKAQTKDSLAELCGLEVHACGLDEHVEDRQTQMLVPVRGG